MNISRSFYVLKSPHISEKGARGNNGYLQYTFEVLGDATKAEIKAAAEKMFDVKVRHVRVCRVKGKSVRFGKTQGRQKSWKKAYVTLQADEKEIDLAS